MNPDTTTTTTMVKAHEKTDRDEEDDPAIDLHDLSAIAETSAASAAAAATAEMEANDNKKTMVKRKAKKELKSAKPAEADSTVSSLLHHRSDHVSSPPPASKPSASLLSARAKDAAAKTNEKGKKKQKNAHEARPSTSPTLLASLDPPETASSILLASTVSLTETPLAADQELAPKRRRTSAKRSRSPASLNLSGRPTNASTPLDQPTASKVKVTFDHESKAEAEEASSATSAEELVDASMVLENAEVNNFSEESFFNFYEGHRPDPEETAKAAKEFRDRSAYLARQDGSSGWLPQPQQQQQPRSALLLGDSSAGDASEAFLTACGATSGASSSSTPCGRPLSELLASNGSGSGSGIWPRSLALTTENVSLTTSICSRVRARFPLFEFGFPPQPD